MRQRSKALRFIAALAALCATRVSLAQSAACLLQRLDSPLPSGYGLWEVALSADRIVSAYALEPTEKYWGLGVYERSGAFWSKWATIVPVPEQGGIGFGREIGVDGDRIITGAPLEVTANGYTGAAYVFERAGSEWHQVAKLVPSDLAEYDRFGETVCISGDIAAVGAPYQSSPVYSAGAIYVFERDASGVWSQEAKLAPASLTAGAKMGWSLACHDNIIVAGAPFDTEKALNAGAAYVFERDPAGTWLEKSKLFAGDGAAFDNFGTAVAVQSNTILVGSPQSHGQTTFLGAVHVYESNSQGTWKEVQKLESLDAKLGDKFGCSVALDGDLAVVGADNEKGPGTGAAYGFVRSAQGEWTEIVKLQPSDLEPKDTFGDDVAIGGNIACVRTWPQDAQNPKSASVYIFAVGPDLNSNGLMDPCECPGDLNKDWIVDQADLGLLLANWGCTGGLGYDPSNKACPGAQTACCGDLDADGDVDQADLGVMLQNFGNVCP